MQKRKESEHYREMFEEAPDGIFTINAEGTFLLVNQCFCQMVGYRRDELLHMNIRDTCLELELDLMAERIAKLRVQNEVMVERSVKRKDGSLLYAQFKYKVIKNEYVLCVVRKVGVEKDILEQLDKNEERFRQIAEHLRDVFFLIDLNTSSFLYVSSAYEKLWEQPIENLFIDPLSWTTSIHPSDRERILLLYQQQMKTGNIDTRYRILRKDGSIRWIHARTFPIYNKQNQLYRSAGVAEDETEHMQITQERTEYEATIQRGFNELVIAISKALEKRDAYTSGHQNKVASLAVAIAQTLNLSPGQIQGLALAAQVHDIGKIGIPIEILTKPTKLSKLEYELIKTHCEAGYDILKGVHFPWPIAEIVREHHERFDGSGYPRGLKGDQIRLEAQIIAVADTIDSMSSHRPYRAALGIKSALAEIQKFRGIHYNPKIVDACQKLFQEKKIDLYST